MWCDPPLHATAPYYYRTFVLCCDKYHTQSKPQITGNDMVTIYGKQHVFWWIPVSWRHMTHGTWTSINSGNVWLQLITWTSAGFRPLGIKSSYFVSLHSSRYAIKSIRKCQLFLISPQCVKKRWYSWLLGKLFWLMAAIAIHCMFLACVLARDVNSLRSNDAYMRQ